MAPRGGGGGGGGRGGAGVSSTHGRAPEPGLDAGGGLGLGGALLLVRCHRRRPRTSGSSRRARRAPTAFEPVAFPSSLCAVLVVWLALGPPPHWLTGRNGGWAGGDQPTALPRIPPHTLLFVRFPQLPAPLRPAPPCQTNRKAERKDKFIPARRWTAALPARPEAPRAQAGPARSATQWRPPSPTPPGRCRRAPPSRPAPPRWAGAWCVAPPRPLPPPAGAGPDAGGPHR